MCVSAGVVSRNSEPQPKARPNGPGPGAGLLPGDRPAESPCYPLQKRVREGDRWWQIDRYERPVRKEKENFRTLTSYFRTIKLLNCI